MASKGDSSRLQTNPSPSNSNSVGVSKVLPVLTDNNSIPGGATINRKKQKRRQKQQATHHPSAQDALSSQEFLDNPHLSNGSLPETQNLPDPSVPTIAATSVPLLFDYALSSATTPNLNQSAVKPQQTSKKKKKNKSTAQESEPHASDLANLTDKTASQRPAAGNSLWDTNGPEERSRIKAFWLNLTESERRDLVNIEKSHVLQKMKEQQKHSCSCSVCGRKRTAIEEELESLLKDPRIWADPTTNPPTERLPPPPSSLTSSSRPRHNPDFSDDQDDDDYPDDDPGDFSDEFDDEDEEDYSEDDIPDNVASNFFHFGNSLTVKDGVLSVADDLLKNDGQKFIDMMEQLAERRMQREEDARYGSAHGFAHGSLSPPPHGANHLGEPPMEDDEYEDEEDDYDDEADLDYDDDDEEEMDALTEDQRMEEGRRMFQIFAARMFEQRVVTAYREKVAYERQQALIDEQEQDTVGASEAKKSKNAEKKKRQRQAAKEAKALKDAAKEEEKQRKEAAVRAAEDKKKEEQKQKQEEQRKKKEAEKQALEEKKRKKEAEIQKRLEADRERQQEQERKNREQKAEEKRRREEAEKKKREEKEAREREIRDKRTMEETERKQLEEKAKPEPEAHQRKQKTDQEARSPEAGSSTATFTTTESAAQAQANPPSSFDTARRPPPQAVVAVPPTLRPRASQTSYDSPSTKIATPALPKASTPSRAKDTPILQTSDPHISERTPPSKSSVSPKRALPQSIQPPGLPQSRQQSLPISQALQSHSLPLGVPLLSESSQQQQQLPQPGQPFGSIPFGVNGPGGSGQMPPGMIHRMPPSQQASLFQSQGAQLSVTSQPQRASSHGVGLATQTSRAPFGDFGHRTFSQQLPQNTQPLYSPQREVPPPSMQHTRQLSSQFEGLSLDTQSVQPPAASQPIGRPAPIKRPSSVNKSENRGQEGLKSSSRNKDVDDLSNHLGSSALLDDTDEPLPSSTTENRRPSAALGSMRSASSAMGSPFDFISSPFGSASRAPGESWNRTASVPYGAPGIAPIGHGQASSVWGGLDVSSPSHGWGPASSVSSSTSSFGMSSHHRSAGGDPRAVTVRLFTVQACKSLSSQSSGVENTGFFDISDVVRATVEGGRQMHLNPGIQLVEIRNILNTEGDSNNGGGTFTLRTHEIKGSMSNRTLVRWVPDQAPIEPFPRQSPFYHQHPAQQQQQQLPQQQLHQSDHLQGPPGHGPAGGPHGQRQGLGLGDIGSPGQDARLPNLGGLGRF